LVSYIYLWYKAKQRFRAEEFQIPQHRKALSLSGYVNVPYKNKIVNRINIAIITFSVGLTCATLVGIFSNLYHKWKKIDSFKIFETNEKIILKNNPLTNLLSAMSYFFILSLFSFVIATNKFNLYVELVIIYLLCLSLAIWNFVKKRNYNVVIEKESKKIILNAKSYLLENYIIEVSLNRRLLSDDITSYGLYLKNQTNKYVLIYGYSIYRDIENLKNKLTEKINSC
jgi:hypothetical protein